MWAHTPATSNSGSTTKRTQISSASSTGCCWHRIWTPRLTRDSPRGRGWGCNHFGCALSSRPLARPGSRGFRSIVSCSRALSALAWIQVPSSPHCEAGCPHGVLGIDAPVTVCGPERGARVRRRSTRLAPCWSRCRVRIERLEINDHEQSCQEWNIHILCARPLPCGQSKSRLCEVTWSCSARGTVTLPRTGLAALGCPSLPR